MEEVVVSTVLATTWFFSNKSMSYRKDILGIIF